MKLHKVILTVLALVAIAVPVVAQPDMTVNIGANAVLFRENGGIQVWTPDAEAVGGWSVAVSLTADEAEAIAAEAEDVLADDAEDVVDDTTDAVVDDSSNAVADDTTDESSCSRTAPTSAALPEATLAGRAATLPEPTGTSSDDRRPPAKPAASDRATVTAGSSRARRGRRAPCCPLPTGGSATLAAGGSVKGGRPPEPGIVCGAGVDPGST